MEEKIKGENVEIRNEITMVFDPRKRIRIPEYDYTLPNYYYLTVCTYRRKCIFGTPEKLNYMGLIVKESIEKMEEIYPHVRVDKYVVMPNHVHMILILEDGNVSSVPHIVNQFKGSVSKRIRKKYPEIQVWQRNYYEHIIRNQKSYEQIWLYIEGNPQCWDKDDYYIKEEKRM